MNNYTRFTFDRPLPEATEAERAICGAMIYRSDETLAKIGDLIGHEDFMDGDCRTIFATIVDMRAKGQGVDLLTLRDRLKPRLDGDAGQTLGDIVHTFSETYGGEFVHSEYHAKLMLDAHARRQAIQESARLAEAAWTGNGDFSEALEDARHRLAGIDAVSTGQKPGAVMRCMADITPIQLTWMWKNRIPRGKLSIIGGVPGQGKSYLTLDIASRVSRGVRFVDEDPATVKKPENVILISGEDDPGDTVRPRLEKLEADLSKIHFLDGISQPDGEIGLLDLGRHVHHIEDAVRETEAGLLVIDPILCFLGELDANKETLVRSVLAMLGAMAARLSVTVVVVSHVNKNAGMRASHRFTGSQAFSAMARSAWIVGANPERPEHRAIVPAKWNLAEKAPGLAFDIHDGVLRWHTYEVSASADDVLNYAPSSKSSTPSLDDAKDFLTDILATGERSATEIKSEAEDCGIAEKTLWRAYKDLGIKKKKTGFQGASVWYLPGVDYQSK